MRSTTIHTSIGTTCPQRVTTDITSVFREFQNDPDYYWLNGYDIPQIFIWNADSIKGTKLVYDVSMDVSDSNCNMMPVRALEPRKHQKPPWHGYSIYA